MENQAPLFRNKKGQVVGRLVDGAFLKRVQKSKHLFRMFDAWGIDTNILKELESLGCREIRIGDEENLRIYTAPISVWLEKGIERDFDTPQTFLPRKHFNQPDGLLIEKRTPPNESQTNPPHSSR